MEENLKEKENESKMQESGADVGENCPESSADTHDTAKTVTLDEAERREREAYLRGRNEAVAEKIAAERNIMPAEQSEEPGIESIFTFRESVWD